MKSNQNFYDLSAKTISGQNKSLSEYKNQVLLIVNTASNCGFTPQYEGLEKLYQTHKTAGLQILGFPCNQFGGQEPGNEKEIQEGCLINYGVSFQMFSKIDVNGKNESPIFKYLKQAKGGFLSRKIKWNFTKFLVDKNGTVVKRYASLTKPESIEEDIKKLLT
ncbi:MAG: glutathione peroxidase [Crocinitomicaceae bacterium]